MTLRENWDCSDGGDVGGEEVHGVVYAVTYRLTTNVLILWPLLTPMGAFFNNLNAGDIDLPVQSLLGFADVAVLMTAAIWLAHRRELKQLQQEPE